MKINDGKTYIIPKEMRLPLILVVVWNCLAYYGARLIVWNIPHYSLETPLDAHIPFIPRTIVIYFLCFIFWAITYILVCRDTGDKAWNLLSANFLSKVICFVCFVLFPTMLLRPEVGGTDIWQRGMRSLYYIDRADNLFPSIHCLESWLTYIAVRKNAGIPKWYRIFYFFFVLLMCMSTLTTKQHVIADAFSGVFLAEICWRLSAKTGFYNKYRKMIKKFTPGR